MEHRPRDCASYVGVRVLHGRGPLAETRDRLQEIYGLTFSVQRMAAGVASLLILALGVRRHRYAHSLFGKMRTLLPIATVLLAGCGPSRPAFDYVTHLEAGG